jgi:hypothetical protein
MHILLKWRVRKACTRACYTVTGCYSSPLTYSAQSDISENTDIGKIETLGRATAQAVSHWLPTAAARVRTRIRTCGICGGQSDTGVGFLRILQFPLPIIIPPIAP